jgi:hypothetical protein
MKVPYKELIQNAVKAPSGHNTQPCKFGIGEPDNYLPEYGQVLTDVDAGNHTLFINPGFA